MNGRKVVTLVCLCLSVALGVGSAVYIKSVKSKADAIYEELAAQEPEETEVVDETTELDPSEFLAAAEKSGQEIVEIQTKYLATVKDIEDDSKRDAAMAEQKTLIADLKTHFKDNAYAGICWYAANDYYGGVTWTFETNYVFAKSSVNCQWTCRDTEGNVMAYVTAKYDANAGLFGDAKIVTTSYGFTKMSVTLQNDLTEEDMYNQNLGIDAEEYASSIFDMVNQNNVGATSALSEEDEANKADAYSAREKLRQEYENGGGE